MRVLPLVLAARPWGLSAAVVEDAAAQEDTATFVGHLARWRARTPVTLRPVGGDLDIMPPRERPMWKDREVLRLKASGSSIIRAAISWPDGSFRVSQGFCEAMSSIVVAPS